MAQMSDVTVRLRAIDEVSPAIRRVRRQLWWLRYGMQVIVAGLALLGGLLFALGFVLGAIWS